MSLAAGMARLADQVEAWLSDQDIALTMGGEPTFIAADPEGAEWNTAAIGPQKLGYARRMSGHLLEHVYPGALVMQVFGKLYPGEPLPRWNLLVLHEADADLWPDHDRLLLNDREGSNQPDVAQRLMQAIAKALLPSSRPLPVAEAAQPATTVGWVLPLDRDEDGWRSDTWPTHQQGHVRLIPGDSPVGLRLPLSELDEETLRRALTVEVRDGALEVFLPPLDVAGFDALLAVLRRLATELDLSDLVFCGYPPADAADRYTIYGLASDPGVLEANLPVCEDWRAYDRVLRQSFEAADAQGLKLTRFALNGAVHGTGGGAHLTFGGPSSDRNPFRIEPQRIASLLRYWQHHPSLSYLFSGQYVGPGCQAPRIDEGPRHGLYELEVACEGLQRLEGPVDAETVDHHIRHIATDSSGNTHRTEICFDKFGNPSAPNGRMGIIELRAFETFATVGDMSTLALFIRAVLARLFKAPFDEPLRRFGPELHDRYFLPAFLWLDLEIICAELAETGFDFDPQWLRPIFEFRFPVVGRLPTPAGEIEVRQALESWPLLAEESAGAATVRRVDNSTDRLQVALPAGADPRSGTLLVNGVALKLHEVNGRWLAGVRYKSASAWPALHPHVPVQSPLRLEWVDDHGVVRAAARYDYWNPDGPVYDGRPADADEARARRQARWRLQEDRIGERVEPSAPRSSPEFSVTLDLRRNATEKDV